MFRFGTGWQLFRRHFLPFADIPAAGAGKCSISERIARARHVQNPGWRGTLFAVAESVDEKLLRRL
jgi:hypothetical protein